MVNSLTVFNLTNAGITQTFDPNLAPDFVYVKSSSAITLSGDVSFVTSPQPVDGWGITYFIEGGGINLNGHTYSVEGVVLTAEQLNSPTQFRMDFVMYNGDWVLTEPYNPSLYHDNIVNANILLDETVTLTKIEDLSRGSIIRGYTSNRPTAYTAKTSGQILIGDGTDINSVAVSGDITINSSGVTAIGSGVIVNADVNASAAIARTKIANGTASQVVINDGSGALSSEAYLATTRGGTHIDSSGSTGFPTVSAGTWSVGALTDVMHLNVSWNTGYVGDFKIKMPFAGTLTDIYGYITQATVGASAGTCIAKNNAGTTVTGGTITTTAGGDARGTAYSTTPTANHTFIANDILTFTTATATAGEMQLSISYTRNS